MNEFAKRLHELRKENGLSKIDLANIIGVSDSTVSRWENGEMLPKIDKLKLLVEFFQVSADYLLGLIDI